MQTITYTLSLSGISPTDLQDGGVQGDHCKTALVFCPDEALWSDVSSDVSQNHNIRCRVDASDGAGGYHPSALLTPDPSTHAVTYPLERSVTQAGGVAKLFLILSEVDENSREVRCLYSFPASLRFADSPAGGAMESIAEWEINGALDAVLKALAVLEDSLPVETENIADEAVTAAKLADDAVTVDKISDGSIVTAKLADGAVTAEKIPFKSITSDRIKDLAITPLQIAPGAVIDSKLADGAVTGEKIAPGAVTGAKIAEGTIDYTKLSNSAVTAEKLAGGAVTTGKIQNGAVTAEKLDEDVQKSIPRFGVCNTHQSTPDKVVDLEDFTLYTGAIVAVQFVQGNYANGNLTLNINGTGAKPVYLDDNAVYSELPLNWGAVVWFCYDGGGYQVMVMPNATTDWAGKVKLNNTLTSTSDSEALTAAQGKALKDMIDGISDGGGGGNSGLPFYSQYNFNIDEVTEDCIRVVGGMTTGTKPPCNNYALVTTFTPLSPSGWSDGGYMLQMAQSDNGKLYTRYNYSTPPNWSAWQTGSN
ncbi:MAG TPA: hypothetical protein H9668_09245 [Firmicutes bacterium]|nr:hypothetical protein [Bacillota bacterium]